MSKIRVLLAEDHIITRQGIRRLLEDDNNYTVIGEASNGEEAIKLCKSLQPDVIIMDIAMPGLNGVEATKQIKKLYPTIPVLILSAYEDDEYVFGLLEVGVAGYLLKTASGDELTNAIQAVYNGEPVLDPSIARKVMNRFQHPLVSNEAEETIESLSSREMEIIKLAAKGLSNQQIASEIVISKRTVEGHMRSIFNKLGVGSRTEAVIYGLKKGWFTLKELPDKE
ncbi:MAG: response regulator transcription factor [Chloroflexi bacterium]|nr:response regulator transcription factor [Chloroflexota bacterium]